MRNDVGVCIKVISEVFLALVIFTGAMVARGQGLADSDYKVDADYHANHCEFYIDQMVVGSRHLYHGSYESFFQFFIKVNSFDLVEDQGGSVLKVGAYAKRVSLSGSGDPEFDERNFEAEAIEDGSYSLILPISETGHSSSSWEYGQMAFFLEIRRADDRTDRLWITNGDFDFSQRDILDGFLSEVPVWDGNSKVFHVLGGSPIYNQRAACQ